MEIYLPAIKSRPEVAFDYFFQEDLADVFEDFPAGGRLKVMLSASCSGEEVFIRGSIEAMVRAECSRCLESFEQDIKTDFMEVFVQNRDVKKDDTPESLAEEAANKLSVSGDYLYLDEYVRQVIVLAQAYSPLCSPSCKGICSGCGVDLNKSSCQCPKVDDDDRVDSRLLKLREWKFGK